MMLLRLLGNNTLRSLDILKHKKLCKARLIASMINFLKEKTIQEDEKVLCLINLNQNKIACGTNGSIKVWCLITKKCLSCITSRAPVFCMVKLKSKTGV